MRKTDERWALAVYAARLRAGNCCAWPSNSRLFAGYERATESRGATRAGNGVARRILPQNRARRYESPEARASHEAREGRRLPCQKT